MGTPPCKDTPLSCLLAPAWQQPWPGVQGEAQEPPVQSRSLGLVVSLQLLRNERLPGSCLGLGSWCRPLAERGGPSSPTGHRSALTEEI